MVSLEDIIALFHCLPSPSILVEPNSPSFTVVAVNQSFNTLNPHLPDTINGLPFVRVFPSAGEQLAHAAAAVAEVLTGKKPQRHEDKIGDETAVRTFSIDTYPFFDSDGNVIYIVQSFVEQSSHFLESKTHQTIENLERNHDLFNFSPMPMWVYDVKTLQILAANEAACRDYGYTVEEFIGASANILAPTEVHPSTYSHLSERAKIGLPNQAQVRYQTKSGKILDVEITSESLPSWSEDARIIVAVDVTEKLRATQAERLFNEANELERNILALHAQTEVPTTSVLTAYLSGLSKLLPELTCTIMQVRNNRIHNWSAPDFPASLIQAFDGLQVGPLVGSCGTAAHYKEKVIVADILNDQRWESHRDITLEAGFRACWSYPIIDANDNMMGTFALYKKSPSVPNQQEEKLIESAISLLTVILENRQLAALITENSELMKQGQSLARFGNWSWEIHDDIVTWSDELFEIYGIEKEAFKATFEAYQGLLHIDDRERITWVIAGVLATKEPVEFEERIIRPTREIRYLRSWASLKCDEQGHPLKMIGACLDITESKKILQELSAKEARLQNLVDAQTNYVMRIDAFGFYTYYNNKFRQDFGWIYGEGDFTGAEATLSIIPEYRDVAVQATFKCVENPGKVIEIELAQPGKNGQIKRTFWHMVALVDHPDAAPEIQCIGIDITEKIAAEAALAQSESRFKKLIQEGTDLISIFDADGKVKYISPNAEKVLGYFIAEIVGRNAFDFVYPTDREKIIASLTQIKQEKRIELPPFRMVCRDGEMRWVETIATDLTDDEAVGGIIANARDVTQRVMDELANKAHLERYNAVAKATSDTIWDHHLLTDEISWNHGIQNVFGYDTLVTTYEWWHEHVHPDDIERVVALVDENIERKNPRWSSEYRFRCKDGSYKVVFDRGFLHFNENGQLIRMIGAMQDITERVKYIQQIEQHNDRLKDIAWIQSHVVRGPLTRIMGLIPLFTDPNLDEESKLTALKYLKQSAEQLDLAIKEIVDKVQ